MRTKDLMTQVKGMPKELKPWKLYNWLTEEVKKMSTVLPLVNDLHSETMRDRHWKQIMVVPRAWFGNALRILVYAEQDGIRETCPTSNLSGRFQCEMK